MIVLGIETSSPSGGVTLMDDQRLLASQMITSSRAHSRLILPAVESMLRELELAVNQIDVVAVTHGPGSFTGVRVGLTLAKALCESGAPRLVTLSTLEALAWCAFGGENVEFVVPLLNARRGEVYGAIHPVSSSGIGAAQEEFACAPDALISRWPGRALVAGEGAIEFGPLLRESLGDRVVLARHDRMLCSPDTVALLGLAAAQRGEFADPATCMPVYLREAAVSTPKGTRH